MQKRNFIIEAILILALSMFFAGCNNIGITGEAKKPSCVPGSTECNDCVDNDGDGKIDYSVNKGGVVTGDPDCASATDICERLASTEVCDSKDNDCDGSIDEGLGSTTCGTGVCLRTVQNCVNGQPQTCTQGNPVLEICDGKDNDCDGTIDDGVCIPIGNLHVTTAPTYSELYVDDIRKGRTAMTVGNLTVGNHKVNVTQENYNYSWTTAYVYEGQTTTVHLDLSPI